MSVAGAGGAGGLPSGLERHGQSLAAGAAEPGLMGVGGLRSGLHDAGAVEGAVGLHESDLAEADHALDATAGAEEAGRNLDAVGLKGTLGVGPGEGSGAAAVGHWKPRLGD